MLDILFILDAVTNYYKIFVNGHGSIHWLIECLLVLLEFLFCNLTKYVHYMEDQIYCLDFHEPCLFIAFFCDFSVFNGSIFWSLRASFMVVEF